jgi:hypothetical protein
MARIVEFDTDVCFEDEEFGEMLEKLSDAVPGAFVKVYSYHGPGGGWPAMSVRVPEDQVRAFAEWYTGGDEVDYWMGEFMEYAKVFEITEA